MGGGWRAAVRLGWLVPDGYRLAWAPVHGWEGAAFSAGGDWVLAGGLPQSFLPMQASLWGGDGRRPRHRRPVAAPGRRHGAGLAALAGIVAAASALWALAAAAVDCYDEVVVVAAVGPAMVAE